MSMEGGKVAAASKQLLETPPMFRLMLMPSQALPQNSTHCCMNTA
jgi:hypothetical protein